MAKDDNLDAAEPNKDKKNQEREEPGEEEEREEIHEQGDQVGLLFDRRAAQVFGVYGV